MKETRAQFTHDELIREVRNALDLGLKRHGAEETAREIFSNLDNLMAGLAVFSFKFPSLLKFDEERGTNHLLRRNLTQLFQIKATPCDTQMRTRLDKISPHACRPAFSRIFTLLQRGKVLDHFHFLNDHYLISLDGTGVFSSSTVHCENCCVKEHRDGTKTYYHQILAASLVHPDQSVVFPFAPEPILKQDGAKKNDCERNAAKRWIADFKREHPHLKAVILGDGLASNAPFIQLLQENNLRFLLVCQEGDHPFLTQWVKSADPVDTPLFTETIKGVQHQYQYMLDVPLTGDQNAPHVTVVRYKEITPTKTRQWMWVTDLKVNKDNIKTIVKGGRARWKIENETFNTLKNQGYEFEHNFGHGTLYLNQVFSSLMMLAFFIDQCLARLNKRFQAALAKCHGKKYLWQHMLHSLVVYEIPNFETLYHAIADPPPISLTSVI